MTSMTATALTAATTDTPATVANPAVEEAIALLTALRGEGVPPEEAWERLGELRCRHPGQWLNLVWERETYGDKVHYDLLLGHGAGTLSLSYCPDEDIPWPVRGLQRVNESMVLRVNDDPVRISEVVTSLDYAWHKLHVGPHLVNMSLVDQEVRDGRMEVTAAELTAALDEFRRRRSLWTAADLARWMAEHGTTEAQLESHLRQDVAREKLRHRIAREAGGEEAWLAAHPGALDTARVARLYVEEPGEALRLHQELQADPDRFLAVARERFLQTGEGGELFSTLRRGELAPETAAEIFATAPGGVTPPLPSGDGFELFQVLALEPARLDDTTRALVRQRLFDEWLAARRATARVEWFWGEAEAAEVPAVAL